MGHLNAKLATLYLGGQHEGRRSRGRWQAGRGRGVGVLLHPPSHPHLHSSAFVFPPIWCVSLFPQGIFILSPACISHLTSCPVSHSSCPGCSIALIVALALRRPEWESPRSSKPGHLLVSLLHVFFLALSPLLVLPFLSQRPAPLHGLSSLLPHGRCLWWM